MLSLSRPQVHSSAAKSHAASALKLYAARRRSRQVTARTHVGSGVFSSQSRNTGCRQLAVATAASASQPAGSAEVAPVAVDPANPTSNVAFTFNISGLDLAAAAANAQQAGSRTDSLVGQVPKLQEQVAALSSDVKGLKEALSAVQSLSGDVKGLKEALSAVQNQNGAIALHQRMLSGEADDVWNCKPVNADIWMPGKGTETVTNLILPKFSKDFKVRVIAHRLQSEGSNDNDLLGFELLLAQDNPVLQAFDKLQLPISLTIRKGTSITVTSRSQETPELGRKHSNTSLFATWNEVTPTRDIKGRLKANSGVKWMFSRDCLNKMGLCGANAQHDLQVLQAQVKAGCKLTVRLSLAFGSP